MNLNKTDLRNRLNDECRDACTWLKDNSYNQIKKKIISSNK